VRGGDVSSLYRGMLDGGSYRTASGVPGNALSILGNAGMNYVRLRVWVHPGDGFDDQSQLLAMAKQAQTHHMNILLDLHYSDTWADPGHQTIPAAWSSDTYPQLKTTVRAYSKRIVASMVKHHVAPAMVQIANEINNGILWPLGSATNFPQLAGLVKSRIAGVKAADPKTKIVLHLAAESEPDLAAWYAKALAAHVQFDIVGLSYYDYWAGRLDVLQSDLDDLAARFHKPVLVAETAYPWTLAENDTTANVVGASGPPLDPGYPATPAGQAANFRDVLSVVRAVPYHRGLGAFYWEPTWTVVPGNGWDPTEPTSGDGWENQAMFDYADTALPVTSAYAAR
jgi:arabinogalactan endo-1,4-beta-galactosidase